MNKRHWFQYVSGAILFIFLGILTFVTIAAYSRRAGATGLDMVTIQKTRYLDGIAKFKKEEQSSHFPSSHLISEQLLKEKTSPR